MILTGLTGHDCACANVLQAAKQQSGRAARKAEVMKEVFKGLSLLWC